MVYPLQRKEGGRDQWWEADAAIGGEEINGRFLYLLVSPPRPARKLLGQRISNLFRRSSRVLFAGDLLGLMSYATILNWDWSSELTIY
uniref:Uncharacterized protein n=1 Tax=Setaria viridis TaxID=4556 RepID=A0A4V6Y7P0_SETVI|nr:hypothetical protein SEVIR_9G122100v2 [Setaria viridis]TKV91806.1 hypothetical protein SEVIR_9G122100v2 [Setaria viridis]TKV91807.1 hypothetical protein SEVIR_9G122100v2 [Setaria viridis]